jgi:tetratricopeptide (TPR) repeat protein
MASVLLFIAVKRKIDGGNLESLGIGQSFDVDRGQQSLGRNTYKQLRNQTGLSNTHSEIAELDLEDLYCILQASPYDTEAALEVADRLVKLNRTKEAYKVLCGVVRIDSRFETLLALGLVEYRLEMNLQAFEHLQQALVIAPVEDEEKLFEVFKTLGNIHVRKGDFDSGEDNYFKAHRLQPESDALLVNLGTLYIQKSKWDEALERFREAIKLNAANDKAWVGLAIGHHMKSDFELAWGNIETALELNPVNDCALTLALEWSVTNGKEFRALELLRRFLIAGGWSEKFSLAFVWLSWRRGDRKVAFLELERLLAVNPANQRALELSAEMRTQS